MAVILVLFVLMMATPGTRAHACEGPFVRQGVLRDVRPGLPNQEAVRVTGVVTGYGTVTRAVSTRRDVDGAATLRIRIQDVVSGRVGPGGAEVVPLRYGPDCRSIGHARNQIGEIYKIGSAVVVFGESVPRLDTAPTPAILAESNQGGFVAVMPGDLPRVPTGELDFGRLDHAARLGVVLWFEFDRALLGLADASPRERFARLQNLADYSYSFHAFPQADREFFSRLVSDSGVSATEARGLLDKFDAKSGADASQNPDSRQLAIKVPGKVDAVFSTTQRGFRNVEIVFPGVPSGQKQPNHAYTQVWLLKADGTTVIRTEKAPEIVTISNAGHDQARAMYTFRVDEAVPPIAIVVQIDQEMFVFGVANQGRGVASSASGDVDRREFAVVAPLTVPGLHSVYVDLSEDEPRAANKAVRVHRLADSLYLRVIAEGHVAVARGVFAYAIQLSRDAAGESPILPTNQPRHGPAADYLRAADFRNSDNTGPNEIGPKNVNAAGEFREVLYPAHELEIRVLSFEIVGLGPSKVPAFARVSFLATVRARRR